MHLFQTLTMSAIFRLSASSFTFSRSSPYSNPRLLQNFTCFRSSPYPPSLDIHFLQTFTFFRISPVLDHHHILSLQTFTSTKSSSSSDFTFFRFRLLQALNMFTFFRHALFFRPSSYQTITLFRPSPCSPSSDFHLLQTTPCSPSSDLYIQTITFFRTSPLIGLISLQQLARNKLLTVKKYTLIIALCRSMHTSKSQSRCPNHCTTTLQLLPLPTRVSQNFCYLFCFVFIFFSL